jgi:hypothetical protein
MVGLSGLDSHSSDICFFAPRPRRGSDPPRSVPFYFHRKDLRRRCEREDVDPVNAKGGYLGEHVETNLHERNGPNRLGDQPERDAEGSSPGG